LHGWLRGTVVELSLTHARPVADG